MDLTLKKYSTLFVLLIVAFSGYGQASCATHYSPDPYFDPIAYQEFERAYYSREKSNEIIEIPFNARIVRHTDGTGGLKPDLLEGIIDTMNARFEEMNVKFVACGSPQFVDVDEFYDFDRNRYAESLATYNIENTLNIYFINKILNDDVFLCGYATFPWSDLEYVVVKNSCALNGSTLAHEVGHYLGLLHTHETARGNELVDGSNCSFTGDEVCDTPADPRLGAGNVDNNCKYTGNTRDLNNDRYKPDPSNLMSYSLKACRNNFTSGQQARMAFYLQRDRNHLACNISTSTVENTLEGRFKIFPNPAQNKLQISTEGFNNDQTDMVIYNALGLEIQSFTGEVLGREGLFNLDISNLSAGSYILKIQQKNKWQALHFVKL